MLYSCVGNRTIIIFDTRSFSLILQKDLIYHAIVYYDNYVLNFKAPLKIILITFDLHKISDI